MERVFLVTTLPIESMEVKVRIDTKDITADRDIPDLIESLIEDAFLEELDPNDIDFKEWHEITDKRKPQQLEFDFEKGGDE